MASIPEGPFSMGSDGSQALEDERPRHDVWLDTFLIDLFEVTTAEYASFLADQTRPTPWQWEAVDPTIHHDRPVIGVDWHDADAYCRWAGKRLPTEAEWEKAARGTDGRWYPWGNQDPTDARANFALGARFSYSQVLMPVHQYESGRSPHGLHHMAGNVWEWTQDWYETSVLRAEPTSQSHRACAGTVQGFVVPIVVGSAEVFAHLWTVQASPRTRNSYTGFRCASSTSK